MGFQMFDSTRRRAAVKYRLKFAHFPYLAEELKKMRPGSPSHLRILDVGCGPGALGAHCGVQEGLIWFGTDLWDHQLRQAKERHVYEGLFQCHLMDGLPLRTESVDVAIAGEVLMYLPNAHHLLNELHRALAPGGTLFVYNPISLAPGVMRRLKELTRTIHLEAGAIAFNRRNDWKAAHRAARVTYYSFRGLIEEIRAAGFTPLDTRGFRIFRNRIRTLTRLENYAWYFALNRRLLAKCPFLAADIMVKARK
jgi:SAM-dependent methyltransferase